MTNEANAEKKPENGKANATPPAQVQPVTPPAPPIGSESAQGKSDRRKELLVRVIEDDALSTFESKTLFWGKAGIFLSIATLVVGIATLVVFHRQLNVMQTQLQDAESDGITASRHARQQIAALQAQAQTTQQQMRIDQRPWAEVVEAGQLAVTDTEVSFPVRVIIAGKTPARDVRAIFFLDKITDGAALNLNPPNTPQPKPSSFALTGFLYPGQPLDVTAYLLNPKAKRIPFGRTELTELQEGKAFVIIYGDVLYTDVFGTHHWTQFCTFKTLKPGKYHSAECTEHNNADSN